MSQFAGEVPKTWCLLGGLEPVPPEIFERLALGNSLLVCFVAVSGVNVDNIFSHFSHF